VPDLDRSRAGSRSANTFQCLCKRSCKKRVIGWSRWPNYLATAPRTGKTPPREAVRTSPGSPAAIAPAYRRKVPRSMSPPPPIGPFGVPKVSIILPTYNGGHYLAQCLSSVIGQSLSEFELLIGDDCSTDSTRSTIAEYPDVRFRTFYRNRNVGLFANLNLLIREARSPLIRFLCQDDLLETQCLEQEEAFFSIHPQIGMSFCKCTLIDDASRELGRSQLYDLPDVLSTRLCLQHFVYHGCIPGNLSTVMVRASALQRSGVFDPSFRIGGDYDLWTRICAEFPMGVIHRHLIRLRSHSAQLSRASTSAVLLAAERRRITERLMRVLEPELRPTARAYLRRRQDVLEVHHALRGLARGRFGEAVGMARAMGLSDFAFGVLWWVLTVDNRLSRPRPRFDESGVS
jgi:glycosyltransferase involved in cell wall biosynthesis